MHEANDSSQESQDWLVTSEGTCLPLRCEELQWCDKPYRLYRFLTEMEDILDAISDDAERIRAIAPRVRHLLMSSYWLQLEFSYPTLDPGWTVRFLYREQDFLITVQMVAWLPGHISPIHNHGTWGIVALVSGEEKNQFWRRTPTREHPHQVESIGEQILLPGDIIGFLPDAIHCVEPLGDEPTVTFNLYGVTDFSQRFEFDPIHHTAKLF